MARFLPQTLESVFRQDFPRIDYIVMDGGSTDGTLDVLRRFESLAPPNIAFRWFSNPDQGTADAINKGFDRSTGSIIAYLNADDTYADSGAVRSAVDALLADPSAIGVYGEADWVTENDATIGRYPTRPFDPELLRSECFICQPACFLRREALAMAGLLDTSLRYAYDYDFWIRLSKHRRFVKTGRVLARSRMHSKNKTLGERRSVLRENITILKRHYGYAPFSHVLAYSAHLIDGRDQFFDPFQPSKAKYLFSLPVGLSFNMRHPFRYAREWASVMTGRHSTVSPA